MPPKPKKLKPHEIEALRCEIEQRLVEQAAAADEELNRLAAEEKLIADAHEADALIEAEIARREAEARALLAAKQAALREKIERGFVEVAVAEDAAEEARLLAMREAQLHEDREHAPQRARTRLL